MSGDVKVRMTLTKQIIKILSDGQPRSSSELAKLTGKTKGQVFTALGAIQRSGLGEREPSRYSLTERGMESSKRERKHHYYAEYQAAYRAQRREAREAVNA